jgi:hypothetical protein
VPLFRRGGSQPTAVNQQAQNLLPEDNVYSKALVSATRQYESLGWAVRIAGCRMLFPGELEIAFVVPGGPGDLRPSLEQLPGPEEVQAIAEKCVAFAHHNVIPAYMSESMWEDTSAEWAYHHPSR